MLCRSVFLHDSVQLVRVHPVAFTSQSAELTSQDTQTLQQVAAVLKTTGATATISTHAGYPDAAQAQQLSQQRQLQIPGERPCAKFFQNQ